ncbi:MAG: nitrogenase component 1, partial [Planctomycetota bacterium]
MMREGVLQKRLSELGKELSLPPKGEVLWIDDHCFMRIARFAADHLEGSRSLLVGPQACLNAIERTRRPAERRIIGVGGRMPARELHYTLLTSKFGAAFGDDRRVAEAIRSIVKGEAPPFLFVITTCMNEVLGLDVEGIVKGMGDLSPTHVIVVQVDTFSGRGKEDVLGGWLARLADVIWAPDSRDGARVN